jgi:cell division control protein 45
MYLPRSLISHLYLHLLRTHHPLSPPVLILVALEPDALCACRILTSLLKRDFIPHKIQPVSGYGDLSRIGEELVKPMRASEGGSGGVVVCLGVGGLVDLNTVLGLDEDEAGLEGVEVWLIDARRPWNLGNVFGGRPSSSTADNENLQQAIEGVHNGQIERTYTPGKGGIIVFDDGDIEEELGAEREAYCALDEMPEIEDDGEDLDSSEGDSEDEEGSATRRSKKRKSWSDREDEEDGSDDETDRPRQRRRSNTVSCPEFILE